MYLTPFFITISPPCFKDTSRSPARPYSGLWNNLCR
jgi:hypothetical protein